MMPRPEDVGAPSNWGRWGTDDERGTANLLRPEIVRAAATGVRRGTVYSLAAPVSPDGPNLPSRRPMWHVVTSRIRPGTEQSGADDVIMMHTHGTTHIDALCHIFVGDTLYNGHSASTLQPGGAQKCGIQNAGPMVSRGVLLDIAAFRGVPHLDGGEAIEPDELDACAARQGVELRAGDVILVRTGWWQLFGQGPEARKQFYASEPGLSGACGQWFKDHDFVALGADNPAVEVVREWGTPLPLHRDVIWGCGGYLLEFLDLEQLGADRVYEFLYVAAPLQIAGGIGSPIAPVAIV
jgi:kynurenine formamidase